MRSPDSTNQDSLGIARRSLHKRAMPKVLSKKGPVIDRPF